MKKQMKPIFILAGLIGLIASCTSAPEKASSVENKLSDAEQKEGWILLFDGMSTNGWHVYNKGKAIKSWTVSKGELVCNAIQDTAKTEVQDLVTDSSYASFELVFEWSITPGGNSGVFINVVEQADLPTVWTSGPEFQLLDPLHGDYKDAKRRSGSLFGFLAAKDSIPEKPAGDWNRGRIKQKNGMVEFFVNDVPTVQQDFTTPAWRDTIAKTYFKNFPSFGKQTNGHIALQDWNKGVRFRNIKLRQL
jgi:hypothetical protein